MSQSAEPNLSRLRWRKLVRSIVLFFSDSLEGLHVNNSVDSFRNFFLVRRDEILRLTRHSSQLLLIGAKIRPSRPPFFFVFRAFHPRRWGKDVAAFFFPSRCLSVVCFFFFSEGIRSRGRFSQVDVSRRFSLSLAKSLARLLTIDSGDSSFSPGKSQPPFERWVPRAK